MNASSDQHNHSPSHWQQSAFIRRVLISVGIFYLFIQSLEGFFLTPMILRRVIVMPPVLILTAQLLMIQFAGFLGILMAMPIVACIMVMIKMLYIEDILGER